MACDTETTLQELKDKIQLFSEKRNWDQFHSPKDLAIGISTEASELLEIFRFKTDAEQQALLDTSEKREAIGSELADVLMFLTRFAQMYDFDLAETFEKKLEYNDKRYSVEKIKGKNLKYTEL